MTSKQSQDNLQNITFRMTPDELVRLDRLADKFGLSRSNFLRNLIVAGLDECEAFERMGIMRAALTVRDIVEWMGDKSKAVSEDIEKGAPSGA